MKPFYKALLLLLFAGVFSQTLFAQKNTLSGYLRDASSGEDLVGATVLIPELATGVYTNEYGFYSLTVPSGTYDVVFRYLSYASDTQRVVLDKDVSLTKELGQKDVEINTVEITAEAEDENVTSTEMSVATLNIETIKKLPSFMGEVDVVKNVQLLPGIQSVGEGLSGYYVRGGTNDQNLILLDEATVFNASHVLGFFSVFNSDALSGQAKVYKGGIPAQYGGRLASVLDLRMKEGNNKSFHGSGGLGLISSRLSFEGPIVKDKSAFMVSGRRSYADIFTFLAKDTTVQQSGAYFYDFNAKANYKISDKDRIFVSGYFGRDVLKLADLFSNDWGNATVTTRWNHLFNDRLFANTTLIYSDFQYGFEATAFGGSDRFEYKAGIRDFNLKTDLNWFVNPNNQVRFGYLGTLHRFNPGQFSPIGDADAFNELAIDPEYALEHGVYFENDQKINERISLRYGLRFSAFQQVGPGVEYSFDTQGEILDSTSFSGGQVIQNYMGFEPRLGARYQLDEKSSIKLGYNRTRQYLHLASNSTASFPWDIWIPSSKHIPPQIADQVGLGYFRNFANNSYEASVEVYYKNMQNQIDFKEAADLILNPTIETEVLVGRGWSYGSEFFLQKKRGKFTGQVGYTLSWSYRQIDGINDNETYRARNDRRHDISVSATYELNKRLTAGGIFVFYTGNAVTFPRGRYSQNGWVVSYYGERNSDRMPDYHRLDLSLDIDLTKKTRKNFEHGLNISCYNVYGRKNAFSIDFQENEDYDPNDPNSPETKAVKIYLFRWVPSVTWNFSF